MTAFLATRRRNISYSVRYRVPAGAGVYWIIALILKGAERRWWAKLISGGHFNGAIGDSNSLVQQLENLQRLLSLGIRIVRCNPSSTYAQKNWFTTYSLFFQAGNHSVICPWAHRLWLFDDVFYTFYWDCGLLVISQWKCKYFCLLEDCHKSSAIGDEDRISLQWWISWVKYLWKCPGQRESQWDLLQLSLENCPSVCQSTYPGCSRAPF